MENYTDKIHVDDTEFQEDGNDSDLEGRLYAEIYYSNEIHDPGENLEDGMKTIQDIKNASQDSNQKSPNSIQNNRLELEIANNPSNSSKTNESPRNDQTDQTDLGNAETDEMQSNVGVNFYVDKILNLEKQPYVEMQSNNILREDTNKIVDENMNPQEKPVKNLTPKQKTPRKKKNKTPKVTNNEIDYSSTPNSTRAEKSVNKKQKKMDESPQVLNNFLTTPKSTKRTFEMDKDSGVKNKRKSLESDKSFLNNTPKSSKGEANGMMLTPISLNASKFSDESTNSLVISPATLAFLFPPESQGVKRKESKNKKVEFKNKIKEAKLKAAEEKYLKIPAEVTPTLNSKQSKKTQKSAKTDEIIEILSSDDFSDEGNMILDTPKVERQNQSDICSDSDESILEVPVPPRPPPPVIDLNDSGSDSSDIDSSNDGIYVLDSKFQTEKMKKGIASSNSNSKSDSDSEQKSEDSSKTPKEVSINNSRSRLSSEQSNHTETSDSSYSDFPVNERLDSIGENLILNCTPVEKCANSLEEIEKMRKDDISEEIEGTENATEYNEYVEPLNDLAEPSTSRAFGSFTQKRSKKNSEQNYKTSKEKTDAEYFFEPMSVKMKAFYNNSWGGEEFSVEDAQNEMRKDRRCWAILDEDWKPALLKRERYFLSKNKCNRCRQSGHLRANCPEPKKQPVCHMCGSQGHYETRCPHKLCLTCGSKQNSFRQTCETCRKLFCKLCRSRGHNEDFCPDLWRQFHHTTSETEHHPPKHTSNIMKPSSLLHCCNCAMQGHESTTCNKYRWTQHYPTPSQVTNYNKCNQLISHTNPSNMVDVANLTESPGESSQNAIIDVELENLSDEEISQDSETDIATTNSNFKTNQGKILFQENFVRSRKNSGKSRKSKDQIVLSDVEGANLEGLIAGTIVLKALSALSRHMQCDICVRLCQGNKVVMNITYYLHFTKRDLFKKFISFWVKLSDEDKQSVKYLDIPRERKKLITILDKAFSKLHRVNGSVQILVKEVEAATTKMKKKEISKVKEPKKRKLIYRCKQLRRNKITNLVRLLYKNNCGMENEAVSNLRKLREDLKKKESVPLDVYFSIIYYYFLIFGTQIPPNLEDMVQNYFILNRDSINRSISNSVSSENSEVYFETRSSENIEDQEYNHEEHEESVCNTYHQNRPSPSIPSLFQENLYNPPSQLYQEQPTSSPGCSNPVQRNNRRPNQFEFPVADFIPISNYRPSEFLDLEPQFSPSKNSNKFRRNPMHNFRTFDPRAPQTAKRLNQEASYLMNKAMQSNLPHLTRAGIQLRDLINQNRLQRKHINHFRHLIISENKRRFR